MRFSVGLPGIVSYMFQKPTENGVQSIRNTISEHSGVCSSSANDSKHVYASHKRKLTDLRGVRSISRKHVCYCFLTFALLSKLELTLAV